MTAISLESLQLQLAALNQRLTFWQRSVNEELGKILDPQQISAGGYGHEQQHDALRTAMMRAGDGPRQELNAAMDELCNLYLETNNQQRAEIRAWMASAPMVLRDLWGYIHRAAEQIRAGGGEQWLRFGLAVVSIEDLRVDYRDTLVGLGDLYRAAVEMKIDPRPSFAEIAAFSNSAPVQEDAVSTRDFIARFDKSDYFIGEVKPHLQY